MFATATAAIAGSGGIDDGRMDLTVYFTYDEPDMAGWEPVFDEFSRLLFDATERQLQLGEVRFTKCVGHRDIADVWVRDGAGGASSNLNGLGRVGTHLFVSRAHRSTQGDVIGQFGLVHEAGHYVFGVYDEFKGTIDGERAATPDHYCVSPTSTVACIMDGGSTISPGNQRHEFCTDAAGDFASTRHQGTFTNSAGEVVENRQEERLGVSCWDRIAESNPDGFALTLPSAEPISTILGHTAVSYDSLGCKMPVAFCLDRSGSMGDDIPSRISLAREAAALAVDLSADGQYLAVTSFSSYVATNEKARGMHRLPLGTRVSAERSLILSWPKKGSSPSSGTATPGRPSTTSS